MRMNSGIILAGDQPNFLAAIDAGNRAAAFKAESDRMAGYNAFLDQNGGALMAGDQNALAAMAKYDPAAALGLQQTHQQMAIDAERMRAAAEEHARTVNAETLAQQAADLERDLGGLAYFHANGDRAGYDAFAARNGLDPAEYSFDNFPAIAAGAKNVLDVWNGFKPKPVEPLSPDGKLAADLQNGLITQEQFDRANADKGGMTVYGPDGQPIMTTGTAKPFTEGQSKDVTYSTRARGALEILDPIAGALTSRGEAIADGVPLGFGREFQTADYQLAVQAGQEFLQAILRKDTGAAITEGEQALYGTVYLPQPGDGPEVLAQKAQSRKRAVEALEAGMSPSQIVAQERALVKTSQAPLSGATVTITNDAEYDALAPGTLFVGPDGVTRRKN